MICVRDFFIGARKELNTGRERGRQCVAVCHIESVKNCFQVIFLRQMYGTSVAISSDFDPEMESGFCLPGEFVYIMKFGFDFG